MCKPPRCSSISIKKRAKWLFKFSVARTNFSVTRTNFSVERTNFSVARTNFSAARTNFSAKIDVITGGGLDPVKVVVG